MQNNGFIDFNQDLSLLLSVGESGKGSLIKTKLSEDHHNHTVSTRRKSMSKSGIKSILGAAGRIVKINEAIAGNANSSSQHEVDFGF